MTTRGARIEGIGRAPRHQTVGVFDVHGSAAPLPEQQRVTAGPFTLVFESGDLRWIRLGPREVVRRVYGAVRDRRWQTIPATIHDLTIDARADAFAIAYTADHRATTRDREGEIAESLHFVWRATITGGADGTICFAFDGEARTSFLRNRIGLCLLHPLRECIGAPVRVRRGSADMAAQPWIEGPTFPALVAREQPVAGFTDLTGIAHEIEPGLWAELTFEGDRFETEDQRNWIDASFKTYSTPLALPIPVAIAAGTRIAQRVTLRLTGVSRVRAPYAADARAPEPAPQPAPVPPGVSDRDVAAPVVIALPPHRELPACGERPGEGRAPQFPAIPLPEIGLCLPDSPMTMTGTEIARLRAMGLAHLRVDVRPVPHAPGDGPHDASSDAPARLAAAVAIARQIGCRLELALHVPLDSSGAALAIGALFEWLAPATIARVLVFAPGAPTTTPVALAVVRAALAAHGGAWTSIPLASGSARDLYQFHLDDPPPAHAICWSIHPQAHATDVSSIAETPEAIADQVRSVRSRHPGARIAISPVMLAPAGIDPRQRSLFGAAWTLAALKHLVESGADSVTCFEAIGGRGVMEPAEGSHWPDDAPPIPGAVFPLYHALADVTEIAAGACALATTTSDPLVTSLLLCLHDDLDRAVVDAGPDAGVLATLLLANLSRDARRVTLPARFRAVRLRLLDAASIARAMREPETFRRDAVSCPAGAPVLLPPFALGRVDGTLVRSV